MAYIDQFFHVLLESEGSDLHLAQGQPPKIRRHGEMFPIRDEPLSYEEISFMLSEICSHNRWQRFEETGDLDFAYEMDEENRFRVNYLKQVSGYGAVFRSIPINIKTLEELGVPTVIKSFGEMRGGVVLVTGPTGSGKSTTLAALVDYINRNFSRHIVTIEEPIEFVHRNQRSIITQREVPEHAASFPAGLKAALREDADIVLVGEMRDLETISLMLTAAETGLLVFGTLHTNNSRKTVDRIVDVFPVDQQAQVRTMLAASLRGVIAQMLLKRADGSGRLAVHEILVSNSAVSAIIREGATQKLQDVIVGGKSEGMQFMDDAIWGQLVSGTVSPLEAYMKAIDKHRFKPFLPADDANLALAAGAYEEQPGRNDSGRRSAVLR
jgi:twitching motility protein PilT